MKTKGPTVYSPPRFGKLKMGNEKSIVRLLPLPFDIAPEVGGELRLRGG